MYLDSTDRLNTAGFSKGSQIGIQQLNPYPRILTADIGERVELKTTVCSMWSMYSTFGTYWKFPLVPPPDNCGCIGGRVSKHAKRRARFQSRYHENQLIGSGEIQPKSKSGKKVGSGCFNSVTLPSN